MKENFPKEICEIGEKSFVVEHLNEHEGRVKDVSMYVRKGEIVGLAGLVGQVKQNCVKQSSVYIANQGVPLL